MNQAIDAMLEPLREARSVVVFSGAGLSADSGVPTFRDGATGLWVDVDPMEVASIEGFARDPEKVWGWHEAMRERFAAVRPNAGHVGIASLELQLPRARVAVITQNIDGLHQAAGSSIVHEVHGSALRVRCHRHCGYRVDWPLGEPALRRCPECGAVARPDVVWFGEALDDLVFSAAVQAALAADVFISVGTSSVVQPAASLPFAAADSGALVIEVNPHPTALSEVADLAVRAPAARFFPLLLDRLARI